MKKKNKKQKRNKTKPRKNKDIEIELENGEKVTVYESELEGITDKDIKDITKLLNLIHK